MVIATKPPVANVSGTAGIGRAGLQHMDALTVRTEAILSHVLSLKAGERVLILHDQGKDRIVNAFTEGAKALGATAIDTYKFKDCRYKQGGVEEMIAKVQGRYDVCLNLIDGGGDEIPDRVKLIKAEMASKARTGHGPGITEEMLLTEVDYEALKLQGKKLNAVFKDAEKVVITTPLGTSIEIKIKGRKWCDDLSIGTGSIGNIPNGEIFCGPIEDGANGTIVVDGSIGGNRGLVPSPIIIEVKDGKIVQENGVLNGVRWLDPNYVDKSGYLQELQRLLSKDEMASVIGELGIGLVAFAVCGNLLQDEKALETIHIAFGNNDDEDEMAGNNHSMTHLDVLVRNPNFVVYYIKESGKQPFALMENGNILI
ncbi:MAG: aminopeptidase [Candidatus Margulisiibacteriota bacterium]